MSFLFGSKAKKAASPATPATAVAPSDVYDPGMHHHSSDHDHHSDDNDNDNDDNADAHGADDETRRNPWNELTGLIAAYNPDKLWAEMKGKQTVVPATNVNPTGPIPAGNHTLFASMHSD